MKANQKICERILKTIATRKNMNPEYKERMLKACERSKALQYKMSPYELDFISN